MKTNVSKHKMNNNFAEWKFVISVVEWRCYSSGYFSFLLCVRADRPSWYEGNKFCILDTTLHTRSTVALTARRLTSYDHLGDHQTIEFDRVITNIGNAYDPRHGHFVAPVKGVYHFTVDIFGWPDQSTTYDLVKNGDILCNPYSVKADDATQGTCSVTIELEVNDMIWVRFNHANGGTRLYGLHNIFSGFLVTKL